MKIKFKPTNDAFFNTRAQYVIENFLLNYESVDEHEIVLSVDSGADILAPSLAGQYFAKETAVFDDIPLVKSIYKEENIPFLFPQNNFTEPFEYRNGKVFFNFDIISAIFLLLSGYTELEEKGAKPDGLGRVEYKNSFIKYLNIITLPLVDYYYMLLVDAIELAYGVKFKQKLSKNAGFTISVTHDIDYWSTIWRKTFKNALKELNLRVAFQSLFTHKANNSPFEKIFSFEKAYKYVSTCFFLPKQGKYKCYENADYNIQHSDYKHFIQNKLNEIGIHPGFGCHDSEKEFEVQKQHLGKATEKIISISRFHFLMFSRAQTPSILNSQGIKIDSTLGFNDACGFRNATSLPFYLFDFNTSQRTNVLEIPLVVMDATLFYGHYLGFENKEQAMEYLKPVFTQLAKTKGCLVLNWHNDAFLPVGKSLWQVVLNEILKYGQKNNAQFLSLSQIRNLLEGEND